MKTVTLTPEEKSYLLNFLRDEVKKFNKTKTIFQIPDANHPNAKYLKDSFWKNGSAATSLYNKLNK